MIDQPVREADRADPQSGAAERLAQIARGARSDREAVEAVRQALEEILK